MVARDSQVLLVFKHLHPGDASCSGRDSLGHNTEPLNAACVEWKVLEGVNDPYDWNNDQCLYRLPLYRTALPERLTLFEPWCAHLHGYYGRLDDGRSGVLLTQPHCRVWVPIIRAGNQDRDRRLPPQQAQPYGRGCPQAVWTAKVAAVRKRPWDQTEPLKTVD